MQVRVALADKMARIVWIQTSPPSKGRTRFVRTGRVHRNFQQQDLQDPTIEIFGVIGGFEGIECIA